MLEPSSSEEDEDDIVPGRPNNHVGPGKGPGGPGGPGGGPGGPGGPGMGGDKPANGSVMGGSGAKPGGKGLDGTGG